GHLLARLPLLRAAHRKAAVSRRGRSPFSWRRAPNAGPRCAGRRWPRASRLVLPLHLGAQLRFPGAQLGRELLAEVLGVEHGANRELDTAVERRALEPLDRLLDRLHLPDPEAGDDLLGLAERAIDDG